MPSKMRPRCQQISQMLALSEGHPGEFNPVPPAGFPRVVRVVRVLTASAIHCNIPTKA
jgi:hypothetical protein